MDDSWWDPTAAWWAKAERARKHIRDINSMLAAFSPRTAYEVMREPTDEAGKTALRLHVLRPLPTELLTTIGDALHNLRSCLDSVAYELARRHRGDSMTASQEGATHFPLFASRTGFDGFLGKEVQRDLYGERERNALRCVQPFALHEEAAELGVNFAMSPHEEYRINQLTRLRRLNNLDKHRSLPLLRWYADMAYFTEMVPGCRHSLRMHTPLKDGDLIGHLSFVEGDVDPSPSLVLEMRLAFADDPGYATDFAGALDSWQSYLTDWVLPRIFIVADGNPPPIMISSGRPVQN